MDNKKYSNIFPWLYLINGPNKMYIEYTTDYKKIKHDFSTCKYIMLVA